MMPSFTKSGIALLSGLLCLMLSCHPTSKDDALSPQRTTDCVPSEFTHTLNGQSMASIKLTAEENSQVSRIQFANIFTRWTGVFRYEKGVPVALDKVDDTGHILQKNWFTFGYDAQNRLTSYTSYYINGSQKETAMNITQAYGANNRVTRVGSQSLYGDDVVILSYDTNGDVNALARQGAKATDVFLESTYELSPNPLASLPVGIRLLLNDLGANAYYNGQTNYDQLLSPHRIKSRSYGAKQTTETFSYSGLGNNFGSRILKNGQPIAANTFTLNSCH